MIMRLIDAEEFKDYIIDSLESYKLLTDEYRDFARDITRGFLKDIDAQPTAYDIDKIIERLEEKSEIYCREYGYPEDENILYLQDAIEIIERGGIEYEFCESK